MKIEITCAPEELKKVLQIIRANDTQVHIDTVAQTAKKMATEPKFKVGMDARVITKFHPYFTKGEEVKIIAAGRTPEIWMCQDGNGAFSILSGDMELINPTGPNPYAG